MKKTLALCGFSALSSGCVPGYAEQLSEEEKELIENILEESSAHGDFLRKSAEITGDDVIVFSGRTKDATLLEEDWAATIERGHELLENNRIFVTEDEKIDEKMGEHFEGYAQMGIAEEKEFVVLRRSTVDEILSGDMRSASGVLMHEFAHIVDPQERKHNKDFEEAIISGIDAEMMLNLAREFEDAPYFSSPFFAYGMAGIFAEKEKDVTKGIEGEENILSYLEQGDADPLIVIRELEKQKRQIAENGSMWVRECSAWYTEEKTPQTSEEEIASMVGEAFIDMRLFHFLNLQRALGVSDGQMIELFASEEGEFLREIYRESLEHTTDHINEIYPEARREYMQEMSREEQRRKMSKEALREGEGRVHYGLMR